jgi:C-methyltransferase
MSEQSRMSGAAVIAAYDFSVFGEIADLGGGHGAFIKAILEASPATKGVLLDLPEVATSVDGSDRLRVVPGSFFADVPQGCDAYILKNVLHDWNDGKALEILANVRRAARPGAKLLVVESVRHEGPGFHMSLMLDVMMLAIHGGRERSRDEFAALFAEAGFRLDRVIPTTMDLAKIVEAVAV